MFIDRTKGSDGYFLGLFEMNASLKTKHSFLIIQIGLDGFFSL